MSLGVPSIPSDLASLKAFAAALQAENLSLKNEIEVRDDELYAKTLHIEKLKAQLAQMKRAYFGRSSEKLGAQVEQMELLIGELEESRALDTARREATNASPSRREKTHPVRQVLPAHLPRERVEHDAACICPKCGSERLTKIGTDERDMLCM